MSYVSWIADEDFKLVTASLIDSVENGIKKSNENLTRNVIDPFTLLFEMSLFQLSGDDWKENEVHRQAQKALTNAVGNFHQKLLGRLTGWQDLGTENQVDLCNAQKRIIAEVKNKFNTLNAGGLVKLYDTLNTLVSKKESMFKGYVSYYVEIIPKNGIRFDECFTPSNSSTGTKCNENPLVRRIDGASFYALATGVEDALKQMFMVLPGVIRDIKPEYMVSPEDWGFIENFFNHAYSATEENDKT